MAVQRSIMRRCKLHQVEKISSVDRNLMEQRDCNSKKKDTLRNKAQLKTRQYRYKRTKG